jgi:hypothetical protein
MMRVSIRVKLAVVALFGCAVGLLNVSCAFASETAPQWTVSSVSRPTNFKPGGDHEGDEYVILVTNTGGVASSASEAVTVTDELPEGLEARAGASGEDELGAVDKDEDTPGVNPNFSNSCAIDGEGTFSCTYGGVVQPGDTLVVKIPVKVAVSPPDSCTGVQLPAAAVSCVENVVRVSGGGAPSSATMQTPTMISPQPAAFGISPGGATNALSSTQAGAHPDLSVSIAWNTENLQGTTIDNAKNTRYVLPAGFAGDLVDTPACQPSQFLEENCPIPTQVGITTVTLHQIPGMEVARILPVFNLEPEPGEVAKIGFNVGQFFIVANVSVRPGGGPGEYGLQTTFYNLNAGSLSELDNDSLTLWGVPAAKIHDRLRNTGQDSAGSFGASSNGVEAPYLSNPTACGAPGTELHADFSLTSWQKPLESENPTVTELGLGRMVGCDRLGMEPKLTAEATTDKADAASGLDLNINVPQTYNNPEGLATSTLEKQVVTLPEGMTVNPSAGAGLADCTPAQYAEEGVQYVEGQGCPKESKLGEVEFVTPSLSEHVKGSVFLAQPAPFGEAGHNPFNSLLALYVVARIPNRGVLAKFPGEVQANPVTGQLVTTFDTSNGSEPGGGLPPLPFSMFTFKFNQGAGAPLVTPNACGLYTITTEMTPYSDVEGLPLTPPIPPFPISSSFNGGACPSGGVPPFKPQVVSGTENNVAGSYSPFYLRLVREDGEQELTKFTSIFPPGLTGNLSGVEKCPEADIEAARRKTGAEELEHPSCPAGSEIGHTLVGAGVGSQLAQAPGKIYLAGEYHGSALSVVSITAAKVGPFDLGTVVIRFALSINPLTAQVEINGANSDPIPHIIKGIVVHVRDIRAYIDRNKFILNPTTCNRSSIAETITGAGANPAIPADQMTVAATAPFQAADCANLKFAPTFKVSTSGKTSRTKGASLTAKLTYPANAIGTQSDIKYVKVDLPRQLPSRLTTLQKACTSAQFSANPAGCPAASRVGQAKAVTPILPVPLEGPAYFVSYGGAKFPELVVVLQGYGFTIDLHGETFINKAGITSSTFPAIPDEPVGSFELTLPEGPDSALAANGNLCTTKLAMPTAFTGQNGDVIHKSTPITVTGCAKHKSKKAKGKGKKGKKSAKRRKRT